MHLIYDVVHIGYVCSDICVLSVPDRVQGLATDAIILWLTSMVLSMLPSDIQFGIFACFRYSWGLQCPKHAHHALSCVLKTSGVMLTQI